MAVTRSGFLAGAMVLGTAAAALAGATSAPAGFPETMRKPPKLRRGDRVGLICPASPPDPPEIDEAIAHIEKLGLVAVLGEYVRARDGYLAGTDAERAGDFNRMARDSSIRAIFSVRGGYGTMRVLDVLDYQAIAREPKIVMGYSDLTAVLNAVAVRSGVVTFHGPVGARHSKWGGAAREYIERALFAAEPIGALPVAQPRRITAGTARGRLAGGNLSLVSGLAGTPFAVPSDGAILFLEETEEAPYRVDRMLTQLQLAGVTGGASGILWGQCTKCVDTDPSPPADDVIDECLRAVKRPALAGAPVGHIPTQWVLPIGCHAELDVATATLNVLEAAVAP